MFWGGGVMSTKIEWATEVWNPVTGCTPISEGCQNCYAKRMATRLKGRFGYPEDEPFKVTFHPDKLDQPLKWKKPRRIFVCSMADLFHGDIPGHVIHEVMKVIKRSNQHTFLILTKRPNRMRSIWMNIDGVRPRNVWLGVSCENQARADERIPILLQIPATKRFISYEPALGPVDLGLHLGGERYVDCGGCKSTPVRGQPYCPGDHEAGGIDWVIAGCESGPNRRPAKTEWFRDLKNQCVDAGIPFFLKQMGTEPPAISGIETGIPMWYENFKSTVIKMPYLDGQRWDQMPQELSSNP